MKFGVPWSVKGIRPEARETAREAARRSGMSLGDWLNSVILEQAGQDGGQAAYDEDDESYANELASVHQRLDGLTRRIEQFTRKGPEAYAPRHHQQQPQRSEPDQIAQLIERLDRRFDQFAAIAQQAQAAAPAPVMAYPPAHAMAPPMAPVADPYPGIQAPSTLDRAVAEIAARQRSLNGQPAPGRRPEPYQPPLPAAVTAPARAAVPSQDISGLEEQLRKITDQIETLRRPGVEEAINALRGELGDIGRALSDAMPKRTLDTLEKQIQGLTQRVVEGRQAGVDGGAAAGVEHALAEVRDALRTLTPAENLVGFQDAVNGLAQRIDLIVAQKDPATLHQLENAITTLRGMAGNVASNEAVGRLADEVQSLADKVDHIARGGPASDVLHNLEGRIDALSRALAERAQNGSAVPAHLEALVQSLSDKIEQVHEIQHTQHAQGDHVAVSHLEDRIMGLVEKLDASEGRLGHLEAIERGLADLLIHIQDIQANRGAAAGPGPSPGVDALKSDIARTHDALDAVHGTLGMLVDRMAVLEKNMRAPAQPQQQFAEEAELRQAPGKLAVRFVNDAPPAQAAAEPAPRARMPQSAPFEVQPPPVETLPPPVAVAPPVQPPVQPQSAPKRIPAALQMPIDPDLPPDQPLEPGSGRPAYQDDPSARIAASEAALGGALPAAGGRSSFIAAARRAAQAALSQQPKSAPKSAAKPAPVPEPEIEDTYDAPDENRPQRAKMLKRMKSFFVAASIVAIVVGSAQILGHMLVGKSGTATTQKSAQRAQKAQAAKNITKDTAKVAAHPAAVPSSGYNMLTPTATIATVPPANPAVRSVDSLLSPPALPTGEDITGTIPQRADQTAAAPQNKDSDRLPAAIGSAELRAAANAGNAAAAYEVGIRFAEGRGVAADLPEAARWYERAAAKGLAAAQFRYASMLEKGQGVRKDLAHARRLYIAAAGQGNAKAMHNLAVLYAEGVEGRPDYGTASKWFHKAAEYGVSDSQYNLGILYARGIGVEKDMGEAYKWFALAALGGDREAGKKRDELGGHLNPVELAAAQRDVESFKVMQQPEAATAVPAPRGGWDKGSAATPAPKSRNQIGAPMVIGKR